MQDNSNIKICLSIDRTSRTPIHQQIYIQLASLINNNVIPSGTRVPSIRALAQELGISDKPVRTAYAGLISDLMLESLPGVGVFTADANFALGQRILTSLGGMDGKVPGPQSEPVEPPVANEEASLPPASDSAGELINLLQSNPDPRLFPFSNVKQSVTNIVWQPNPQLFDRGHAQGYQALVEYIETLMDASGVPMSDNANQVIVTDGFLQSLRLILSTCDLKDKMVLVESPAYPTLIKFLTVEKIPFTDFPIGLDGIDFEALSRKLESSQIGAIIATPTYHNPTGYCYSNADRKQILELAIKHNVKIIEDDWGRNHRLDGGNPQPIKALDGGGYVYHMGSFSKSFLSGVILGWITVPGQAAEAAFQYKLTTEGATNHFLQAILCEFISKGNLDRYIRKSAKVYKARRDMLVETLRKHLPDGCRFNIPAGGFSLWIELPDEADVVSLHQEARKQGVDFLPGHYCLLPESKLNGIRVSFSRVDAKKIRVGAKIICDLLKLQLA